MRRKILGLVFCIMLLVAPGMVIAEEEFITNFKSLLNEDGVLEIDSIPPTDEGTFNLLVNEAVVSEITRGNVSIIYKSCNKDFTECDAGWYYDWENDTYGETMKVKLKYNYDREMKKLVDSLINIPAGKRVFEIKDMELINWWLNGGDVEHFINYSGELKKYISYKNFVMDARMGDDQALYTWVEGFGDLKYNGDTYYAISGMEAEAKHIIYVPESTGNTKEELMAAATKRIEDIFGKNKISITYGGQGVDELTIDYLNSRINILEAQINTELEKDPSKQDPSIIGNQGYLDYLKDEREKYLNGILVPSEDECLNEVEGKYYFIMTIGDKEYFFGVKKSDEDMIDLSLKTSDVNTNITITSQNSSIPLDTLIKANKLTSGEEYDKIIKILDVKNSETFDLRLYSKTLGKYITKLDNGMFEVEIPVSKDLEGKNLIAYYVNENGKVEEHEVIVKDGYATFTTNHFSIYTLAEATRLEITNPPTGDNINMHITIGIISLITLVGSVIYRKIFN